MNERRDVSLEMAPKLGQAFENEAWFWLALPWQAERDSNIHVTRLTWNDYDEGLVAQCNDRLRVRCPRLVSGRLAVGAAASKSATKSSKLISGVVVRGHGWRVRSAFW